MTADLLRRAADLIEHRADLLPDHPWKTERIFWTRGLEDGWWWEVRDVDGTPLADAEVVIDLYEPSPDAETDPDGSKGSAYFADLMARFGQCTCDPIEDGMGGVFGNCTETRLDGCALCRRLDPDWPCPTREHHGYPQ